MRSTRKSPQKIQKYYLNAKKEIDLNHWPEFIKSVFHDPALTVIAESLARSVPICGPFLVQVMKDPTGSWQIIDVNPRVGSSTRICAALGMDFAAANLADHWGEPIDGLFRPLAGEHYVVRQYADYVTSRP